MGNGNNGNLGRGQTPSPLGSSANQQGANAAAGTLPLVRPNPPVQTLSVAQALDRYIQSKLVTTSFLGIPVTVHVELARKLKAAQDSLRYDDNKLQHGIVSLTGKQGPTSYFHSVGCAVDVNYDSSPFLMHEAGEPAYDQQLAPVYERIAQFALGRASVIPLEITQYNDKSRREYLYRSLKEESDAMRTYFGLYMRKPEEDLAQYLASAGGSDRAKRTNWKVGVPPGTVPTWQKAFQQIQQDWAMLTGRDSGPQILMHGPSGRFDYSWRNACDAGMCFPSAPTFSRESGANRNEDAPFSGARRDPQYGFLSFDFEVVSALLDQEFTWGAIGFGGGSLTVGGSGDVMHFELSALGREVYSAAKAAVPGL